MSERHESLSRDLGFFDVTLMGVGAMIGAGIFVLTGEAAGVAGPALVLAFALNGLVTVLTAMVYAELGSAIPEAGGGYLWVKEGLPGASAFLAGWMSWFAHAVAGALYALGFGAFTFELLRLSGVPLAAAGVGPELGKKAFGVAVVLLFALINYRGVGETGKVGNLVTLAKLGIIFVFCLFGLKFMFFPEAGFTVGEAAGGMGLAQLRPFLPDETGWLGVLSAMGLTFIAFEGYEIIVQAGEEVEEPRRNVPRAIFWSLVVVVPLYLLVGFVLVGATQSERLVAALEAAGRLPEGLWADSPNWQLLREVGELGLARAAAQFVPYGAVLILLGGVLSTMSALNATTFSSTRVAFAMGRDRNLPDALAAVHGEHRTPHLALAATAALILLMVVFVPITTVAAAADIMFLLLFLQVNVAVITLRKKYGGKLAYGYLIPFFPLVPILGIVTKLGLAVAMFDHYPQAWGYVLPWLAVGLLLFRFYARGREREREAPVLAERAPFRSRPRSVLVAVGEAEDSEELIRVGARIARVVEGEVVLLRAVAVPWQLPLSAGARLAGGDRENLERARAQAEGLGVPVRTVLRLGRRPARSILATAQDRHTDYLVMGWHGALSFGKPLIGHNIDRVMKESNCHAVVIEEGGEPPRKILVPLADPSTAPLALGVATALLEPGRGGEITVLHLHEGEMDEEERDRFRRRILSRAAEDAPEPPAPFDEFAPLSLEFRPLAGSVASALAGRSKGYDRMILGVSQAGFFRRRVTGARSVAIARRAACPVVFVRPRESGVKFELQHFFQFFRELEGQGEPEEERD